MDHVAERNAAGGGFPQTGRVRGRSGTTRSGTTALVVGVVLLAFNLRPGVTSVPPLFGELADRLGLHPLALTWLATAPVLCFGVFSAPAASLSRRFGEEAALAGAVAVLAAALGLRALVPGVLLFPATVAACASIAVMNVLLTSLVKRRRPDRVGLLLGLYLLALYLGAITGSAISVPLSQATGSPSWALGVWALPAAAALLAWLPQVRRFPPARQAPSVGLPATGAGPGTGAATGSRRRSGAGVSVYRRLLAWQVAGFMGLQSLTYFATLSWLPLLFQDRGASPAQAGFLVSVLGIGGVATVLLSPVLAQRQSSQRGLITPLVAATTAGVAGALFAPLGTQVFWMSLLGLGQGAALGVGLYLTIARAATPAVAASLSAMAQGVGYLVASTGPLLVGVLHSATGGWTVPVLVLLAITVAEWVCGMLAARPLTIPETPAERGQSDRGSPAPTSTT